MTEITKWEYTDLESYRSTLYYEESNFMGGTTIRETGTGKKLKYVPSDTELLNELGSKGWEVVGIKMEHGDACRSNFYLKRPCGRLRVVERVNGQEINPEQRSQDTSYER